MAAATAVVEVGGLADNRIDDYKELIVWKRAMELTKAAYALTRCLPREENFALADQIRRSAVSVPSNIAEGYGRTSAKEYARFLSMARGSGYELETQLMLCVELGYLRQDEIEIASGLINEVSKMLTAIIMKVGNG